MTDFNDFDSDLILITKIVSSPVNKRRITSEYKILKSKYETVYLSYENSTNSIILTIRDRTILPNYNIFSFILPSDYPFYSPLVYLNGQNYINLLIFENPNELEIVKEITGNDCLCSKTVINKNNWGPSICIEFIINEIKENFKLIELIKTKAEFNKLKEENDCELLTKQV